MSGREVSRAPIQEMWEHIMRNVKTLGAAASALVLTAGLATTASAAEMKFAVSGYVKSAFIVSSLNDGYQALRLVPMAKSIFAVDQN